MICDYCNQDFRDRPIAWEKHQGKCPEELKFWKRMALKLQDEKKHVHLSSPPFNKISVLLRTDDFPDRTCSLPAVPRPGDEVKFPDKTYVLGRAVFPGNIQVGGLVAIEARLKVDSIPNNMLTGEVDNG